MLRFVRSMLQREWVTQMTLRAAVILDSNQPRMAAAYISSRATEQRKAQTHLGNCARKIFDAGVTAVLPNQMVKGALRMDGKVLTVNRKQYAIDHNIYIVAFGKAVAGMVRAAEDVLGEEVVCGIASIPWGIQKSLIYNGKRDLLPSETSRVKLIEGGRDNLPDSASLQAACEIAALAASLSEEDIILVLISGGGSALLPAPPPPISIEEKQQVIKVLTGRGATIDQVNTVRKNLSTLKGGNLATIANPAKVISLILSDIIGDPLDLIASGPTVTNHSTANDCLQILDELNIVAGDIPISILDYLKRQAALGTAIADQASSSAHVNNLIIGNNSLAASACIQMASNMGFAVAHFSNAVSGEARNVAEMYVAMATYICDRFDVFTVQETEITNSDKNFKQLSNKLLWISKDQLQEIDRVLRAATTSRKPVCIIGAGETTVSVHGMGQGGRNQELALAAAICMRSSSKLQQLHKRGYSVVLLSAGTDGQDGPTDAAGAVADVDQVERAFQQGLDADGFLSNNDSNTFYRSLNKGQDLVKTGLTGTNVMDLHILLVYPPQEIWNKSD